MKSIRFLKEPGYTYDLFFLFCLYFNKQYFLEEQNLESYYRILDEYFPISDELLLFFYMPDNNLSFMSQYYFSPFKEEFVEGRYNLSMVQASLTDYNQVIENLIKFYFKKMPEESLDHGKWSLQTMNKLIKESTYSGDIKSALYSFFIEPVPIIQRLSYELMAKEFLLSQQYQKSYQDIVGFENTFDFDKLVLGLKTGGNQSIDVNCFENVYISVCINAREFIKIYYYDKVVIILLGFDYKEYIEKMILQDRMPELDVFGNAISEKNRIDILDLMIYKGKITIKDIEKELGFTGTNAYYHLSLMLKADMVKTQNRGRTVLYSINKEYFEAVCKKISHYTE